jgi:hypothetical protein
MATTVRVKAKTETIVAPRPAAGLRVRRLFRIANARLVAAYLLIGGMKRIEHYKIEPCGPDVALGEVLSENEVASTLCFSRKIKRPTSSVERGLTDTMRRRMHTDEFPAVHASTFADTDQLFRPIINSGDPETHCSLAWHGTGARRPTLTGHNATKGLR